MIDRSNNLAYMKDYLYYAFQFEQYVYMWREAMTRANNLIKQYDEERKNLIKKINSATERFNNMGNIVNSEKERLEKSVKVYKLIFVCVIIIVAISFAVTLIASLMSESDDIILNIVSAIFIFGAFFFTPLCIVLLITIVLYRNTKNKLQGISFDNQKRRRKFIASEEIEQSKNRLYKIELNEVNVRYNQQAIQKNLITAQKQLQSIYSVNILPYKYRNLEATGTLYGYIIDGRCTYVKGHGGIYDTFENDYKLGTIILELKKANAALERIEVNQRLLLQEMRKINNTALRIEQSLNRIESDVSDIKCSVAISAAANQQTAASANYMATVMYLNS